MLRANTVSLKPSTSAPRSRLPATIKSSHSFATGASPSSPIAPTKSSAPNSIPLPSLLESRTSSRSTDLRLDLRQPLPHDYLTHDLVVRRRFEQLRIGLVARDVVHYEVLHPRPRIEP